MYNSVSDATIGTAGTYGSRIAFRIRANSNSFTVQGRPGLDGGRETVSPVLINATVVTPFRVAENHCIVIEDRKISHLGPSDSVYLPPGHGL